jgi:hypothetical protein
LLQAGLVCYIHGVANKTSSSKTIKIKKAKLSPKGNYQNKAVSFRLFN